MGFDESGAGVAAGLKWDAIHDPSLISGNQQDVAQYWRQIDHIVHEFEHVYGAGLGEYYNLAHVDDTTGVAPISNIRLDATVRVWNVRSVPPYVNEEFLVSSTAVPGSYEFSWDPYPTTGVFGNFDHLKLIKGQAAGYEPVAQWVSIYDAQAAKLIAGDDELTITLSMSAIVGLGDMNGDLNVTVADAPLLVQALTNRAAYEAHEYGVDADTIGDTNGDGRFDLGDLGSFSALLGDPPSPSAVPEPNAMLLALLALTGVAWQRRTDSRSPRRQWSRGETCDFPLTVCST